MNKCIQCGKESNRRGELCGSCYMKSKRAQGVHTPVHNVHTENVHTEDVHTETENMQKEAVKKSFNCDMCKQHQVFKGTCKCE